jgi:hypothetical protein
MQMNAGLICNHYKLSNKFSKRQKESIEDPSVELSHGSGTCLPQESKGSGSFCLSRASPGLHVWAVGVMGCRSYGLSE